jgi:GT2 family glycosyltransferase
VIVDDGSTDEDTRRLLSNYSQPRTTVVHTPNRGLSAAKNTGAARTIGRYLCMLDADDRLMPRMLEQSVAAFESDPRLAFVSHWVRTFGDEHGDWTPQACGFPELLDRNVVNGAALVRRTALEAVGGFDESMRDGCEDWDFWISLVERDLPGCVIPEILFEYRRRPGSMSRVMMRDGGHERRYAYLAAKHRDTFQRYAPWLVGRRQRDIAHLRRHLQDLAHDTRHRLTPAVSKLRDDVAVLERRVQQRTEDLRAIDENTAALGEQQRLAAQLAESAVIQASLETAHTRLRAEAEAQARQLTTVSDRARAEVAHAQEVSRVLEAEARRAAVEVVALRKSVSWRLTAPLRWVYDMARPRVRRSRP